MNFGKWIRRKSKLGVSVAMVGAGVAAQYFLGEAADSTLKGIIGGVAGGVGQNVFSNILDRWFPEDPLTPSDTLNHHIELAVGHAVEGVLRELIQNGSPHAAVYKSFVDNDAAQVWRRMLLDEPAGTLDLPDVQDLLTQAARVQEVARAGVDASEAGRVLAVTDPFPSVLDEATWRSWLVRLAAQDGRFKPVGDALDELAPALVARFYWHLVQALKDDFAADGRAYAAVQLATTHSILAIVQDQRAAIAEQGVKTAELFKQIAGKLDSIRPRLNDEDRKWIDGRFTSLERKIDDAHTDLRVLATHILEREDKLLAENAALRDQLQGRDADIRSKEATIARLESQLIEAKRLADAGDTEAEAALAYARKHHDISRVVELLDEITDRDSLKLRTQQAVQGARIVDRRLESADYHFRKGDIETGRARLADALDCAPRDVGMLHRIGRFAEAFRMLDLAAEAFHRVLRSTTDARMLAVTECDLGDIELAQGHRRAALDRYHRYLAHSRIAGETREALRDLAVSLNKVGDVELAERGPKEALPRHEESLDIARRIVERFGETPEALRDVSVSLNKVGDVERAERGPKAALPRYEESLGIARRIVERFGETPEALRDVSVSLDNVGDVERAEQGPKAALPRYEESLDIRRRIVERFGETPQALRDVAVSLNKVGDVELAERGPKAALPHYEESLGNCRRIVERFGETPQALRDVSVSLNKVGDVELAERGPKAALPRYEESLAIRRRIVEGFGETPQALRDVAASLYRTGEARAADGQKQAGLHDAHEALRSFEEVGRHWGVNWQLKDDIEAAKRLIARIESQE